MEQNQTSIGETKYAGFWIRFAAFLLDSIVIGAFLIIVYAGLGVHWLNPPLGYKLLEIPVTIFYNVIMVIRFSQTLGKMAMGIQVTGQEGGSNSWGTIILRESIGKLVSIIPLLIGFIMAGFDSRKRTLHDRIAKTYVIKVQNTKEVAILPDPKI